MKSKLLFFDLAICSLWMLSMFGWRGSWAYTALPFIVLEVLFRIVLSFSLHLRRSVLGCLFLSLSR